MRTEIYCDGSCLGNPGHGGYASLIIHEKEKFWVTGNQTNTTNNQMELTALISALEFLENKNLISCIDVYTDSKYVQKGITEWIYNWIKQGWKKKKGEILNIDLWRRLFILKKKHPFQIYWVKAHSDNILNNMVDCKARFMASQLLIC